MATELAKEIMENYVKLKDRPAQLELRVRRLCIWTHQITITTPIENGEILWKVAFPSPAPAANEDETTPTPTVVEVSYSSGSSSPYLPVIPEALVTLIDGTSGHGRSADVKLGVRPVGAMEDVSSWSLEKEMDAPTRRALIVRVLQALMTK